MHPDYSQPYRFFFFLFCYFFFFLISLFRRSNLILEFSQTSLRHRYLDKGLPLRYEWHKLITYMLRRTRFIPIRFHPFLSICFTRRLYSFLTKGKRNDATISLNDRVARYSLVTVSLSDSQCIII